MSGKSKVDFYKIYAKAHNNASDLLSEAEILYEKGKYARAYFLAYTGLEEISKSQMAADVATRFIDEEVFWKHYSKHDSKLNGIQWAYIDANTPPYNKVWVGPDRDDVEGISASEPLWEKRQNSLYVDAMDGAIKSPKDEITEKDAREIMHILSTALYRIWEVSGEFGGNQIGTKGFMK